MSKSFGYGQIKSQLNTIQSLLLTQPGGGGGSQGLASVLGVSDDAGQLEINNASYISSITPDNVYDAFIGGNDGIGHATNTTQAYLLVNNNVNSQLQLNVASNLSVIIVHPTDMTIASPLYPLNLINKGIQLDNASGSAGQVLTSNGVGNACTWEQSVPQSFMTGYLAKSRSCLITSTQLSTVTFSSLPVPSIWVQDQFPPINQNGHWGFNKPIGDVRKFNWCCFDPYYPAVPSIGVPPSTLILKSQLQAFYIIVTINTLMNSASQQGYLYFELYTYDYVNGSTTFFTNQWTYVMPTNALAWVTTASLNISAGQRCLLYARDDQKYLANPATPATFASSNGQALNQNTYVADPINIHPDIPHIAFNFANYNITPTPQPANINNVAISKLQISCTSGARATALNLDIETIGYIVNGINNEFNLNF